MLTVRSSMAKYIKLHRTEYAHMSDFEACNAYIASVMRDFENMEKYLPKSANSILDIGCGLALVDVLIQRKYPKAKLYLLDGDGENHDRDGFHQEYSPYNSREVTEQLLKDNGVEVAGWYDIGHKQLMKADIIISLLSWGYHYPLSTYRVLGKCVICDVRDGHKDRSYTYNRIYRGENFTRNLLLSGGDK